MLAGVIHIRSVKIANGIPPRLYPINVSVCVEEAPGNIWQKALYSSSSCSDTSCLRWAKFFIIIPKCPCGPPNAVRLWITTALRNGIWRWRIKINCYCDFCFMCVPTLRFCWILKKISAWPLQRLMCTEVLECIFIRRFWFSCKPVLCSKIQTLHGFYKQDIEIVFVLSTRFSF